MSNERSPREVCSITIGINGLIGAPSNFSRIDWSFQTAHRKRCHSGWLLATGGPQFRLFRRFLLFGGPDALPRLRLFRRNGFDLRDHAVKRPGQAESLPLGLVRARRARLLDHLVRLLEPLEKGLLHLLVGHLDAELVRD